MTKEWRQYFESQGIQTLAINSKEQVTVKVVTDAAKKLMADKIARQKERGIKIETLRTMIIGIPNAGKSTLMNILGCLDTPTAGSYKLEGLGGCRSFRRRLGGDSRHASGLCLPVV